MTITDYFASDGALSRAEISELLGISQGRLSQLRDDKNWPPDLALRMEEATAGCVDASTLSPVIAKARETGRAA